MNNQILPFFNTAKEEVIKAGYKWEIEAVQERQLVMLTPYDFLKQYIWVVISAGIKNQIAEQIYSKIIETGDPQTFNHVGKRNAIEKAMKMYKTWFAEFCRSTDKLYYLDQLPWIGPITKYHLARNLGMDVVKPDRHLVRLASRFGYETPHEMCQVIHIDTGERLGVIDVILWRYCNLFNPFTN